jgi:hypothetical protein
MQSHRAIFRTWSNRQHEVWGQPNPQKHHGQLPPTTTTFANPAELCRRTWMTGCCHDAGCCPMHPGGFKPNGALRRCCEPMTMGSWILSQSIKESRANAFRPSVAECFMQFDGRREDGEQAVLYSLLLSQAFKWALPLPGVGCSFLHHTPPSAIGLHTVFLFLTVHPCASLLKQHR